MQDREANSRGSYNSPPELKVATTQIANNDHKELKKHFEKVVEEADDIRAKYYKSEEQRLSLQ